MLKKLGVFLLSLVGVAVGVTLMFEITTYVAGFPIHLKLTDPTAYKAAVEKHSTKLQARREADEQRRLEKAQQTRIEQTRVRYRMAQRPSFGLEYEYHTALKKCFGIAYRYNLDFTRDVMLGQSRVIAFTFTKCTPDILKEIETARAEAGLPALPAEAYLSQ